MISSKIFINLKDKMQIKFEKCDFTDQVQTGEYIEMINEYMVHPMGGEAHGHNNNQGLILAKALERHPSAICFFMLINCERAGIATCFINFSTFKIKPYLYIHDFFIKNSFRGKGLSSKFLSYLIYYSKEHDYCKVTLEVRSDNEVAKHVYNEMGFKDCEPPMYFWTKYIE